MPFDCIENPAPFCSSEFGDFRDRIFDKADREHRDHNYSPKMEGLRLAAARDLDEELSGC